MKHPSYYKYPAVFVPDGDGWTVTFPDLENCFTSADTVEESIVEAQAVLEDCMYFREVRKDDIPSPTPAETIAPPPGGFVQIVVAAMTPVRRAWSRKSRQEGAHHPCVDGGGTQETRRCQYLLRPSGSFEEGAGHQGTCHPVERRPSGAQPSWCKMENTLVSFPLSGPRGRRRPPETKADEARRG